MTKFETQIQQGIPTSIPQKKEVPTDVNRAPKRKDILSIEEKKLALKNALRYFPEKWHNELAPEFLDELQEFGRIYMYRFKPDYAMHARSIDEYPAQSKQAAAIMLMIQNNLDPKVAQHPFELITYGGNGAVFQNWAQYLLTMKYLSEMNENQTLHIYSGHPMGLFPSSPSAPRVIVTNGMVIPNYSSPDHLEKFNALGVSQYGQMTAGSYMYIGPQGIVHGTTITLMTAFRMKLQKDESSLGKIFLTSGMGGMSGAQTKAGKIVGCITICAEVNKKVIQKRLEQGWVDEMVEGIDNLIARTKIAQDNNENLSIAYLGNVVEIWEKFAENDIFIHIGSDQTSLHNPYSGGYYPADISFEEANAMIKNDPEQFKTRIKKTLIRHADAIQKHTEKGTYFFDYGNAFMLEASRAGADILKPNGDFKYPSYIQDIVGKYCFDYGFGPFRWVCTSGDEKDLRTTDKIAQKVLQKQLETAKPDIQTQLQDNIDWIKAAEENKMVVGSQARILYADAEGRINIATAFNEALKNGEISAPVVLGRDHHDVSGTDSPYRETSNIYDGSQFTADMAIHNVIGDSFRGATWVSIHNGGGVGWGEVINGGFGMLLDGTEKAQQQLENMLFYDVNNGIARRSWAKNEGALFAIKEAMKREQNLVVTLPNQTDEDLISKLFTT